eukprot:12954014-Alexandrium_andersonii.AAC.1
MNVRNIDCALRLCGTRAATSRSCNMFEALMWMRRRACRVRDGVGHVPVLYWERASVGDFKGRLRSGIFHGD